MVEHDWRNDAACLDEDPELLFPIGESTVAQSQIREAQAVCAVSPVRTPCLASEIFASRGRSSARPRTLRAVDVSG